MSPLLSNPEVGNYRVVVLFCSSLCNALTWGTGYTCGVLVSCWNREFPHKSRAFVAFVGSLPVALGCFLGNFAYVGCFLFSLTQNYKKAQFSVLIVSLNLNLVKHLSLANFYKLLEKKLKIFLFLLVTEFYYLSFILSSFNVFDVFKLH